MTLSMRLVSVIMILAGIAAAQPKRVLYVTHSAGFVHGSIPASIDAMQTIARDSGLLDVTATYDVSLLNSDNLRDYDAVFFFTSGELPVTDEQKQALLDFVRAGKGFGGAHSATDTFYTWPEYGEMIGAYFNGHPWTQEVRINIEDPDDPMVADLTPSFTILHETYQFRAFSRDRVHVLMSLDTGSVDLSAPGVNPDTTDFPVTWRRCYGQGRVFYTALGHFDDNWQDPRVRKMLLQAMLWLTSSNSCATSGTQ